MKKTISLLLLTTFFSVSLFAEKRPAAGTLSHPKEAIKRVFENKEALNAVKKVFDNEKFISTEEGRKFKKDFERLSQNGVDKEKVFEELFRRTTLMNQVVDSAKIFEGNKINPGFAEKAFGSAKDKNAVAMAKDVEVIVKESASNYQTNEAKSKAYQDALDACAKVPEVSREVEGGTQTFSLKQMLEMYAAHQRIANKPMNEYTLNNITAVAKSLSEIFKSDIKDPETKSMLLAALESGIIHNSDNNNQIVQIAKEGTPKERADAIRGLQKLINVMNGSLRNELAQKLNRKGGSLSGMIEEYEAKRLSGEIVLPGEREKPSKEKVAKEIEAMKEKSEKALVDFLKEKIHDKTISEEEARSLACNCPPSNPGVCNAFPENAAAKGNKPSPAAIDSHGK